MSVPSLQFHVKAEQHVVLLRRGATEGFKSWTELNRVEQSWTELNRAEQSWAELNDADEICQAKKLAPFLTLVSEQNAPKGQTVKRQTTACGMVYHRCCISWIANINPRSGSQFRRVREKEACRRQWLFCLCCTSHDINNQFNCQYSWIWCLQDWKSILRFHDLGGVFCFYHQVTRT